MSFLLSLETTPRLYLTAVMGTSFFYLFTLCPAENDFSPFRTGLYIFCNLFAQLASCTPWKAFLSTYFILFYGHLPQVILGYFGKGTTGWCIFLFLDDFVNTGEQCCGSMTFWCGSGSGSADQCL